MTSIVAADVVAVVPTLGRDTDRLRRCLASLEAARHESDLAIVVVWNDPRIAVPDLGDVHVLQPGCNLGYAGSILHARRRTESSFLWFLQDDMRVDPGCLAALLGFLGGSSDVGLVAPALVDDEGFVPIHSRGGVLAPDHSMDRWFPASRVRPADLDTSERLDWVASSGSLVRVRAFDDAGGTDPAFFPVSWSDVDLGRRLGLAGHRVAVAPDAHVRHDRNGSTPSMLARFIGPENAERFRAKAAGETNATVVDVDRDIADAVLTASTNGYLDIVRFAQRVEEERLWEAERLRREVESLRAEVERLRAASDRSRAKGWNRFRS